MYNLLQYIQCGDLSNLKLFLIKNPNTSQKVSAVYSADQNCNYITRLLVNNRSKTGKYLSDLAGILKKSLVKISKIVMITKFVICVARLEIVLCSVTII